MSAGMIIVGLLLITVGGFALFVSGIVYVREVRSQELEDRIALIVEDRIDTILGIDSHKEDLMAYGIDPEDIMYFSTEDNYYEGLDGDDDDEEGSVPSKGNKEIDLKRAPPTHKTKLN